MGKYKIRFNLGRGKNYLKWKVIYPSGAVRYYEPEKVAIYMDGCKLINRPKTAQKIKSGANKEVCAWIEADKVTVYEHRASKTSNQVRYNPRVVPYWSYNGKNVDGETYDMLVTVNRDVFILF